MKQLAQQVSQACQELSRLFDGGARLDNVLYQVEAFELSLLQQRIQKAIADNDSEELKECLDECRRLHARDRAMRKVLEHRSVESASTLSLGR